MRKIALLLGSLSLAVATVPAAAPAAPQTASPQAAAPGILIPHWTQAQALRLAEWVGDAANEGLDAVAPEIGPLRKRLAAGEGPALDAEATRVAIRLLKAHREGCCNASLRTGWRIPVSPPWPDAAATVAQAVERNQLDQMFLEARPAHPFYEALRQHYAQERSPARRATLAANMDRWRWMPRQLGSRYLLVNTAGFEATLWDNRRIVGRWKVVVGKTKSPTPVFAATVTGVIFNPWWEIPASIAAEGIAAMVQKRPAEAARRGYVFEDGRYRQQPGANNALGRMKLVMPNGYNVYLHDTPAQALFGSDVRAFSHGCVRVEDAPGLTAALLAPQGGWDRPRIDALIAQGETRKVELAAPIPVYIAYFTAQPDALGAMTYYPDVYRRDKGARSPASDGTCL